MSIFCQDVLSADAFDDHLLDTLNSVLAETARTQSPLIESTHFLVVLADINQGVTQRAFPQLGMNASQWKGGLAACAVADETKLPPTSLAEKCMHGSALAMLQAAEQLRARYDRQRIDEGLLLLAGLMNLTEPVLRNFRAAGIDVEGWGKHIERMIKPVRPIKVFSEEPPEELVLEVFSPRARKVLSVLQTEAQALGCRKANPRHLLLALLAQTGGPAEYGIHQQGVLPKRVQESVMLGFRGKAGRTAGIVPLDGEHFQAVLRRIFVLSGEIAAQDGAEQIGEVYLFRAFLEVDTVARRILADEEIRIETLKEVLQRYEVSEEEEAEAEEAVHIIENIDTVRQCLLDRLVGQDDAVQRILPYVQRMRFGFSLPGRPEGVFLFCGPSGCGKTEMAKELARAVFGSEEELIYLEMGQFNSRESMNIFVGAPPAYVGYGEGKLTNGLRDKPRSVVLFDEVEKAHPLVLDALLRFLDEGKIGDPAGPVRDGSQCIIVLTSNVGADELGQLWRDIKGRPNCRSLVRKKLRALFKKHEFRPEFLNRVDELVFFRPLSETNYAEITKRFLKSYLERLEAQHQITVEVEEVYESIGAYCATIDEGARAAHRLALSMIVTPAIDYVLRNQLNPPVKVRVTGKRDGDDPDSEPYGEVSPVSAKP